MSKQHMKSKASLLEKVVGIALKVWIASMHVFESWHPNANNRRWLDMLLRTNSMVRQVPNDVRGCTMLLSLEKPLKNFLCLCNNNTSFLEELISLLKFTMTPMECQRHIGKTTMKNSKTCL